jgi:hypothetical protein
MRMDNPLQALLARPDVWQASRGRAANDTADVLPTGHAALDQVLHLNGWPRGALTELLGGRWGIGEMQLLAPALAHCSRGQRHLFFVCPPHLPYAPSLLAWGIQLERLLIVRTEREQDTLWCTEQILRSGASACLLAWLPESRRADYHALRRLQLATQRSGSLAFLFRPLQANRSLSPAALRIALHGSREHLVLEIVKQRGGRPGQQVTLMRDSTLLQPRIAPILLPAITNAASRGERTPHPAADPSLPAQGLRRVEAEVTPCPASAFLH